MSSEKEGGEWRGYLPGLSFFSEFPAVGVVIGGLLGVVAVGVAGYYPPAAGGQQSSLAELQAAEDKRQAVETQRQAVETKLQAVETQRQAVETKRQAVETKRQAVEDKLRCELRSFTWDELVARSEADQAEYNTLCETYGVHSLLNAVQVPFGDNTAGSEAVDA
jgi:hypothetical protein